MSKFNSYTKYCLQFAAVMTLLLALAMPLSEKCAAAEQAKPLVLKTMGSFMFGGTLSTAANGETFHGDHGYAQYFIPQNAKNYPVIMWHGMGQSGKSWESTPDGREGFMQLLPRAGYAAYIIDQPRRGRAGYTQARAADPNAIPTTARESGVWNAFRNGLWLPPNQPYLFANVQFPSDAASMDQFFRQQTPDTGEQPFTAEFRLFMGKTVAELLTKTGPGILVTHSNSGQYGWATAMVAPEAVKAIVAYEPGMFCFPEGERPAELPSTIPLVDERMQPQMVPLSEFQKLTQMPIVIIYGDNIASEQSEVFNSEVWRIASRRAKQFVDTVNRHGGDAQLVLLPEIGIYGNTHAPFADLNNIEIFAHLEHFLQSKGLDVNDKPHQGPLRKETAYTVHVQK